MSSDVFLLGGTGFIGREFVTAAVGSGARVRALVRTREGAAQMERLGAAPVLGDAAVAAVGSETSKARRPSSIWFSLDCPTASGRGPSTPLPPSVSR